MMVSLYRCLPQLLLIYVGVRTKEKPGFFHRQGFKNLDFLGLLRINHTLLLGALLTSDEIDKILDGPDVADPGSSKSKE